MRPTPPRPPPAWVRKHLRPGETVAWWARPSLVGLAPIVASALLGVAGLVVTSRLGFEEPSLLLTGTPALVVALVGLAIEFGRKLVRLRYTTYVLTGERLYAITSFLETDARSVPFSRVSHVAVRRGFFGALLGFWNARVGLHGDGASSLEVSAIRDGQGLLRELTDGQRKACDAGWLVRGD